jgi:alpha-beta hydrolase superfamily lysophospholipase
LAAETKYRGDHAGDWGTPTADAAYSTDTYALPDGAKLFFRSWRAADPTTPTLVLMHGLGAHSGWFIDMGNELHTRGLTVYAPDHRGFGRSEGPRGHTRDWRGYPRDVESFLDEVQRRQPGAPLFLLGHSMGGLFAIFVAADDASRVSPPTSGEGAEGRGRLAGVILMNPWIKDTTKLSAGTQAGIALGGLRRSARIVTYPYDVGNMTGNPEAHQLLADDPNWVRSQSASFLFQIGLRMRGQALKRARQVRAPALVLQSEADRVIVQRTVRRCFARLGSQDKTYKTYPGFAHDCEFEPQRAPLDDDIAQWVMAHRA